MVLVGFVWLLIGVVIGTPVAIVSMRLTSQTLGGVDFGEVEAAVFKAATLVAAGLGVQFGPPVGVWLSLGIWSAGVAVLFRPGLWATVLVAAFNWGVGVFIVGCYVSGPWSGR